MIEFLVAALPADGQLDPMRYVGYYIAACVVVWGGILAYAGVLIARLWHNSQTPP